MPHVQRDDREALTQVLFQHKSRQRWKMSDFFFFLAQSQKGGKSIILNYQNKVARKSASHPFLHPCSLENKCRLPTESVKTEYWLWGKDHKADMTGGPGLRIFPKHMHSCLWCKLPCSCKWRNPDLSIKWGEISLEDIKRSGTPYQVTLPHTSQRNS